MNRKIGLKRGTVRLAPHTAEWSALYEEEKARLEEILAGLPAAFEHVGSTAIPGLEAKPIIDVALGIPSLDGVAEYIHRLETHGYHDRGALPGEDRLLARGPEERRTHYVHIVEHGGTKWQDYILFRDYMCSHPAARKAYASLKEILARKHAGEREKYTAGKHQFIQNILAEARKLQNGIPVDREKKK